MAAKRQYIRVTAQNGRVTKGYDEAKAPTLETVINEIAEKGFKVITHYAFFDTDFKLLIEIVLMEAGQ